jgi:hypothetical protein
MAGSVICSVECYLICEIMLKSALTEQLATGCGGWPQGAEKTRAPMDLLSNPAFPCLRFADGPVIGASIESAQSADSQEVDVPDIAAVKLAGTTAPVGSVPTDKVHFISHCCT